MATALDGVVVLILAVAYSLFVNSLNMIAAQKYLLWFPAVILLLIFFIYSYR
jgi:hypothetical protein